MQGSNAVAKWSRAPGGRSATKRTSELGVCGHFFTLDTALFAYCWIAGTRAEYFTKPPSFNGFTTYLTFQFGETRVEVKSVCNIMRKKLVCVRVGLDRMKKFQELVVLVPCRFV